MPYVYDQQGRKVHIDGAGQGYYLPDDLSPDAFLSDALAAEQLRGIGGVYGGRRGRRSAPRDLTGFAPQYSESANGHSTLALSPYYEEYSREERARRDHVRRQGSLEWQRIAQAFSDPSLNLSEEQKADVLNQYQANYGWMNTPNPIDIVTAEEQNSPEVRLADARTKVRALADYQPFYESLVKTNKDGEIDFTDLIKWRELEMKMNEPAKQENDNVRKNQAYQFELKQHAEFKPNEPGDDATPEEIEQYKADFNAWQDGQRKIWNQYFGDFEQFKTPPPPAAQPNMPSSNVAPPKAKDPAELQQFATSLGVPLIDSGDKFDELLAEGAIGPGDSFVDDTGAVYTLDAQGIPRPVKNAVGK